MKALDKAIQLSGGLTKLAEKIGATVSQVGNWRIRGVPVDQCVLIEKATEGEVRCEQLNDAIDWEYLRSTTARPDPAATPIEAALRKRNGGTRTHGDAHDVEKLK